MSELRKKFQKVCIFPPLLTKVLENYDDLEISKACRCVVASPSIAFTLTTDFITEPAPTETITSTSITTTTLTTSTATQTTDDLGHWETWFAHASYISVAGLRPGDTTTALSTPMTAFPSNHALGMCAHTCARNYAPACQLGRLWFYNDGTSYICVLYLREGCVLTLGFSTLHSSLLSTIISLIPRFMRTPQCLRY